MRWGRCGKRGKISTQRRKPRIRFVTCQNSEVVLRILNHESCEECKKFFVLAGITLCGGFALSAQTWIQTSAPTNIWSSIACSADGAKIYACAGGGPITSPGGLEPIYISTNGGLTWTNTAAPSNYWANIACSADGTKVIAAAFYTSAHLGGVYTSTDGGATWLSNNIAPSGWFSVASSADGAHLFAVNAFAQLLMTTNAGLIWVTNAQKSLCVGTSADGNRLIIGSIWSTICTSINLGATWVTNNVSCPFWTSVAISADGKVLAVVTDSTAPRALILTSTNFGATWVTNGWFGFTWDHIAVSADGTKMIAASGINIGPIFTSTNSGQTWISNNVPFANWNAVACSADGNKLMAVSVSPNGSVWISQTTPSPTLSIASTNDLQLSWLIPSTNFVLQQSSDLANWSDVINTPVLNLTNLQNQVTLPLSADNSFYRLKTP